ncbi:DUF6122 family protein [Robertkochia aurantiaca]|uniref:DUF6122 family protein n=1 Tax=Robertkochia aurantiaca TaxID=2873700 RepID=UPI001CCF2017|nr:DUF6122 family protein [Robertkochia sp. 3YJGBD-33]
MIRESIHYGIHFLLPVFIAFLFFKGNNRVKVLLILWAGIIIDIDHLLADPVFNPDRCSIGYHFLHSYIAITVYLLLLLPRSTRIPALALCLHIIADSTDCYLMYLDL